jgi:CDP-diglyceride synthetase
MDGKKRRELRTRLVIAPSLLAAVGLVYWLDEKGGGGRYSAAVLGLLSVLGLWEYIRMVQGIGQQIRGWLLLPPAVALHTAALFFGWHKIDNELYPPMILVTGLLFPLAVRALSREPSQGGMEEMGFSLLGIILLVWPFYLAQGLALRMLRSLLFVVLVSKSSDIGAYLVGIAVGRRKLIPHISPGKSVEGALGGLMSSALVAWLLSGFCLEPDLQLGLTAVLATGIMLSITTQLGDLVESLLKRRCGVKDSSRLLPAHGGILDLTDSLLFSVPAFFAVVVLSTGEA